MGVDAAFSDLITFYLFIGGAGAGASLVTAILSFMARNHIGPLATERSSAGYPSPAERSYYLLKPSVQIAWIAVMVSISLLVAHIGRIDRVLLLFLYPTASFLTIGAFALAILFVSISLLGLIWLFDIRLGGRTLRAAIEVVTGVAALTVMIYTGLLLQDVLPVTFWMNPLLPILFALSSLSTGIALICLSSSLNPSTENQRDLLIRLLKIDAVVIVLELLVLAALMTTSYAEASAQDAVSTLLIGGLAPVFWFLLIGIGLILPALLEWRTRRVGNKELLVIAMLLLVGGLTLRWSIVEAGSDTVNYPGVPQGTLENNLYQVQPIEKNG